MAQRMTRQQAKKQLQAEADAEADRKERARQAKMEKETYQGKMWKPVKEGSINYAIGGKKFYYRKYEGDFNLDEIRKFSQKMSNALSQDGRAKQMQVSVIYKNERDRSGKMTAVGEDVDVQDLQARYNFDLGDIEGFIIYLN